jgi:hypothetical protein
MYRLGGGATRRRRVVSVQGAVCSALAGVQEEGGAREGPRHVTAMELSLAGLRPAEDPFDWLRRRWAAQIAEAEAAGATLPPQLETPVPPLQPVTLHVELADPDGEPTWPRRAPHVRGRVPCIGLGDAGESDGWVCTCRGGQRAGRRDLTGAVPLRG